MSAPVSIIWTDGSPYTVPPDQLQQALDAGAVVETPEHQLQRAQRKEAEAGSSIPAFAASAAGSLPFIGGHLQKLMDPTGMEVETHPLAGAAGTGAGILGQVLGIAATGGTEALAEGAGLIGEGGTAAMGLAGRTAVRGALGAAEGGLYGAGGAVNDSVLGDHPLTAEMLLSHAAGGALLGGVLAGGLSLGGDALAGGLEKVGNKARASTLGNIVDTDLREMADAGIGQKEVNRAFREGLVQPGDTPMQVQSRVADRVAKLGQDIVELGQKLDGSGQTFDLRQMIVKAGTTDEGGAAFSNLLQKGDEAAPFARLNQLRESLLPQTSKAAKGLLLDLDDAIFSKAGNISSEVGESARTLLGDQREFLKPLSEMADAAVSASHVPAGLKGGGALDAIMRQGSHFATWNMLGKMVGGHVGVPFLAMSTANFLRKVVSNPAEIAGTFLKGLNGISKATGLSQEALESAVGAALRSTRHAAGPVSGALRLKPNASDLDVEQARERINNAIRSTTPGGNPYVTQAIQKQRQMLLSVLPPPAANPNLPKSLARPSLGPSQKAISRYNATLQALEHPMGIIADVGAGRATKIQTDALLAAYPMLAARAGYMLFNGAASSKKTVPASLKRGIETLRGVKFDPAMDPAKIARIQAVFASSQTPEDQAGPQGGAVKPSQKGLSNIDLGERTSLGMQQASERSKGK